MPPEATASHTWPPEKKSETSCKKIGTSVGLIPVRLQSVKMVGH